VNSPGPDGGADCGATWGVGGVGDGDTGVLASARGSFGPPIELNILVNAPGTEPAGAPGPALETWEAVDIPTVGSFGGFSIATGLKTRATSFVRPVPPAELDGLDPALPLAPGIVSACSMRVNSPGLREGSGGAGGAAAGSFTGSGGSGATACIGGAVNAGCGGAVGAGGAASGALGVVCPSSDASKSSSARGAEDTCPKTPVALDGCSVFCESVGSNGFLGASMHGHLACLRILVQDSNTISTLLDSKGQASYDANTIGGSWGQGC
jgi:hypothetical protein